MSLADPTPSRPDAPPDTPKILRLHFHGSGATLFGIHIVNLLLVLVTLGIYYFWAKVRVRTYLWSQTELHGDRFAYHGTGRELLVGWLKAAAVFGLPLLLLVTVPELLAAGPAFQGLAFLLAYAVILVFIPVATVGARRYRLSRTSWRGIRLSFRGRALDFVKLFLVGGLLSSLTMGFYYPFFEARRYAFLMSHSQLGNRRFGFDGRGEELLILYLLALALGVGVLMAAGAIIGILFVLAVTRHPALLALLLGPLFLLLLGWAWFTAKKQRYVWDHTTFERARFHSTVTTWPMLRFRLANLLLLVLTLGLGWPWVTARTARFTFRYLTLEGPVDMETIEQDARGATATGEGLAGFLDVGFDLG